MVLIASWFLEDNYGTRLNLVFAQVIYIVANIGLGLTTDDGGVWAALYDAILLIPTIKYLSYASPE